MTTYKLSFSHFPTLAIVRPKRSDTLDKEYNSVRVVALANRSAFGQRGIVICGPADGRPGYPVGSFVHVHPDYWETV